MFKLLLTCFHAFSFFFYHHQMPIHHYKIDRRQNISPTAAPTPIVSGVPSIYISEFPTPTITPTPTVSPTPVVSGEPTATPTLTPTPTIIFSETPIPTTTLTPTAAPTPTSVLSGTPIPTTTPTPTTTLTPTVTPTATPTVSPTLLPTETPIPTTTPTPTPTITPTPTATETPIPTTTPSPTSTITPTVILTPTLTATPTPTGTSDLTDELSPTLVISLTPTASPTPTIAPTDDPTATPSPIVSPTPTVTPTPTPVTKLGNDVSYPQCGQVLPSGAGFGIVGIDDGIATTTNPCLSTELLWAEQSLGTQNQAKVQLYVNTGNPGTAGQWPSSNTDPAGNNTSNPYGTCDGSVNDACSWQYGWNRAVDDVQNKFIPAAQSAGVDANPGDYPLWLDVETANSWNSGSDAALEQNRVDLEAMVTYFQSRGITVGIYSTSYMWSTIVGSVPSSSNLNGLRTWLPGATDQSSAQSNCSSSSLTSGGSVTITQYTANNFDYDYSCL